MKKLIFYVLMLIGFAVAQPAISIPVHDDSVIVLDASGKSSCFIVDSFNFQNQLELVGYELQNETILSNKSVSPKELIFYKSIRSDFKIGWHKLNVTYNKLLFTKFISIHNSYTPDFKIGWSNCSLTYYIL